ncbi:hypothetical protein [Mycobacterium gordonae]|uniref:GAF domain-containing protein n=1 Tax=Mycobacterium gordonae TaxID=1778 RepID=A0A1X1VYF1_MYCGO|nr:hypothetical protein [Mycobacterium gordonae]MCV7006756.1 hypothetical protein [Mycobacterium gordonae]ODR16408.1 hypothetical protein BHQ23_30050 [Mycobacterium gordonae]ORV75017.1 hypothetical protein AWC08_00750 [Mycobacterium gordonae]
MTALWLGYWLDEFKIFALAVSAACLASGGGVLAVAWVAGLVLIVVGAAIPALQLYWARQGATLDETTAGREKLLEEVLQPLLELGASVALVPAKNDRVAAALNAARQAVRDLTFRAFGTIPGIRTVVYNVSDDQTKMVPLYTAGRPDRPGDFVKGTPRGDKAFQVLCGKDPFVFAPDLDRGSPVEWAGSGVGYKTFITAPIRSQDDGYGLLTIDAPVAGTLDKRHGATLSLFAATLGVLFAEAIRGPGRAQVHSERLNSRT